MASTDEQLRGWVSQSHDRGTLDIILSCIVTTILCLWTSVCVNVPAPDHAVGDNIWDRWHMICLGVLGPEFVLLNAVGQYCSARASVQEFSLKNLPASENLPKWTMKHAFFADMGGIHLKLDDLDSFPINAKQVHFLVLNSLIPYPDISIATLDDKNKSDILARY